METKKTIKANLEKGKTISFMMGAVVALALLFTAFEWGAEDVKIDTSYKFDLSFKDVEDVVITRSDLPEPPKQVITQSPDILVLVSNEKEVEPFLFAPTDDYADKPQPVYISTVVEKDEVPVIDEIYISVEIMPEFPGGINSLLKWISENVNYPAVAAENGIQGRVSCTFVVNADGSVSDVEVLRSIDPNLDKEAIRVLKLLPKWKPGVQQGKNVRVRYSVPVHFILQK